MVSLRRADEYPKRVLLSIYNQKKAKLEEQETENGCTQKKKKKKNHDACSVLGAKQIFKYRIC